MTGFRFFLGGHDLEMLEIADLLREVGLGERIVDHRLAWGATLADVAEPMRRAIAAGETAVAIEMQDDPRISMDRSRLILIDHHGPRAGRDAPSALRQVYELVGRPRGAEWTRRRALVEANDIGHAVGLRRAGATAAEVRAIRDADRAAQSVSVEVETESRRAVDAARRNGALTVVDTSASTASAVADFLLAEYGGPDPQALLVIMPGKVAFFGPGRVVAALAGTRGGWYGGDLPDRGYWGALRSELPDVASLEGQIVESIGSPPGN